MPAILDKPGQWNMPPAWIQLLVAAVAIVLLALFGPAVRHMVSFFFKDI